MTNAVPTFSVVIPVYNTVKELRRCVESITAQTYDSYEVILVDDGSKDGSSELCDVLAEENSHVICIHKENGGCSEARNTGIRAARGNYLLFVDSDDMWDDVYALQNLNRIIMANPGIDVICFGLKIIDENGKLEKIRKPELPNSCGLDKASIVEHLVYTNQYFSSSYVKALRKDFFIENDLFFIKGLLSEDIEWSARILVSCKNIDVYPKTVYKRIRREEGSITSAIGRKNILDILNSIEKGVAWTKANSENEQTLKLYYEYWAYQYAMLLGLARVMKDDEEYSEVISRLKELKWLLKYDHVGKVRAVRVAVSAVGIRMAMRLLSVYYARVK